ncbi:putative anti-sigma factor antagonist BtrV [Sporotomaculum syntrophicum]|uniref:Anti-sigma factor antagonist n=1 Tax=Sporotomaculum syntrophicum TaxID=182264 RepID=A0A9D2WRB6_9FIRM|nr:STAS domain-containing protein [Sporotomaculum syntrophicum]KAF1086207.1 putative anti-sigma factor antagonist BtrV [Sporotomaculum syntrophicum]
MKITKNAQGNTTTLALQGRLDTVTSTQLANELSAIFEEGAVNLVFDFTALEYISSAGLRVILTAQKKINAQGTKMEIVGANESVKEIFDITGFSGIMKIN